MTNILRWNPKTSSMEEYVPPPAEAEDWADQYLKSSAATTYKPYERYSAEDKSPSKLYFAYGSNLHQSQMIGRCEDAITVSALRLPNWRLEFRGVADVVECPEAYVDGALWRISKRDEDDLDLYEGYPRGYTKRYFNVTVGGETEQVMMYVMTGGVIQRPVRGYFEVIAAGYWHWTLDPESLLMAVQRAGWYEAGVKLKDRRISRRFRDDDALSDTVVPRMSGQIIASIASGIVEAGEPRNIVQQAADADLLQHGWW